MRVTQHSGRKHRTGKAYSTKHNDRNFSSKADNIDREKTADNIVWTWYDKFETKEDGTPLHSIDEVELVFYQERYGKQLAATNEKYIKARHKERVKSMDEWRKQIKHAPEEVITQIGKMNDHPDLDLFTKCFQEYLRELEKWNLEHGDVMHILDWSLHQDEIGAPHTHIRRVWDYYNPKTKQFELGQEKALEAAGVPLPHPDKAPGRFNNRKMTFDAEMRTVWQNICKENGLEIETIPLPKNEVGMSLDQKIRQNEEARRQKEIEAEQILKEAEEKKKALAKEQEEFEQQKEIENKEIEEAREELKNKDAEAQKILDRETSVKEKEEEIKDAHKEIEAWEEDKKKTDEYMKQFDFDANKEILKDSQIKILSTPEQMEENFPLEKTGTFTKETHFEYGNRIVKHLWNWAKKRVQDFQTKYNELKGAVKNLFKENLELKKRNSELEKENKKISESINSIVAEKVRQQSSGIIENAKKEALKEHEKELKFFNLFIGNQGVGLIRPNGTQLSLEHGKQSVLNMDKELDCFESLTPYGFRNLAERMEKLKIEDGYDAYERMKKDGCKTLGEWLDKPIRNNEIGWSR